jgi:hypothetical protein
MDPAGFAAIFTKSCACRAQVRAVRRARAHGEHYIDQVHIIKLTPNLDGSRSADVLVSFNASAGGLVDGNNRRLTSAPAARGVHRDFELAKVDGVWLISRLVVA